MARKIKDRETKTILSDEKRCDAARRQPGVKDARLLSPSGSAINGSVRDRCFLYREESGISDSRFLFVTALDSAPAFR
jgi:hypothetical protein